MVKPTIYYVAWSKDDNPNVYNPGGDRREPTWYRVWRNNQGKKDVSVTPPMTQKEAYEKLRMIRLLDQPAQKELDL